jgi:hypothetical protein
MLSFGFCAHRAGRQMLCVHGVAGKLDSFDLNQGMAPNKDKECRKKFATSSMIERATDPDLELKLDLV